MQSRTYRYFNGDPLYAFGYGLSYTQFAYSNLKLSSTSVKAGDNLTAEADVRNTGQQAGDEVAELYLTPPRPRSLPSMNSRGSSASTSRPEKHSTFASRCIHAS